MTHEEGMPLYLQIAESVRRRIAAGELAPGDRLPPVREMARQWGCTPGTVVRAYAELVILGASQVLEREVRPEDHQRLLSELTQRIDARLLS